MMKRTIPLLLFCLAMTGCSTGDDSEPMQEPPHYTNEADSTQQAIDYSGSETDGYNPTGTTYLGMFAAVWTAGGQQVGATTLQVGADTQMVGLPIDHLTSLYRQATGLTVTAAASQWRWNMQLRQTGYSSTACYFDMDQASSQWRLDDGRQLTIWFNAKSQAAIYDERSDRWTVLLPIDSISVTNSPTCRFAPAHEMRLTTTQRLNN